MIIPVPRSTSWWGAYTWLVERGQATTEEAPEVPDLAPEIEDDEGEAELVEDGDQQAVGEEEGPGHAEVHGEDLLGEGERELPEDFEIEVFRLAVPVADRSAERILEAIIYLYMQLRADGYQVQQIHTDRAREFMAKNFVTWCLVRSIHKTTTSGDSPQQNGRAERAVQYVKARIRVLLLSASWSAARWPLACWNTHSTERLRRLKKAGEVPSFGAKVLVRKRFWKSKELEPTHQEVEYIASLPETHGHLVRHQDGSLMITAYVLQRTSQPPELEDTWLAVQTMAEEKEDALEIRRRIRGKTSIRSVALEYEREEVLRRRAKNEAMEMESLHLLRDEEEVAKLVHRHLKMMLNDAKAGDEVDEEVLRTKVVPVVQFLKEADLWTTAIETEMNQLFQEKGALRRATMAQLQRMREEGKEVALIPSKLVITMKPGPKRKVRIVACGNYVESKGEELYAAGADASALRLVLKITSEKDWELQTTDVRVAFLNAPLMTTLKDGTEGNFVFALKPPSLLVRLNFAKEDEVWVAEKAMYGLRQAPRCWSIHRDEVLRSLRVRGCFLRQVVSEANLWILEKEDEEEISLRMKGMMLVYVDDLLIAGEKIYAEALVEEIQKTWQTSNPEKISDGQVTKFLGMEIYKEGPNIKASQASFIKDRLSANLGEGWKDVRGSAVPCSRDIGEVDDEKEITTEEVREAQRVVGELLWLVTRTRMDLMYVTSRLSQMVLRAPREVLRASKQVWAYLKKTASQGLLFTPDAGVGWAGECELGLQAYSDASFAPGGGHSIGAVIIKWNGSPMLWRAGKQPFPTLSAAEAELTEATEALLMGDSFDAILTDIFENYPESLMIDNQAAIQLISEENGAWRTRHLRLRAGHLRWRFSRLDWRVIHCPGVVMAADLGTKPLAGSRIEELKKICGMSTEIDVLEVKREEIEGPGGAGALEKAIKLLVVASLIQSVAGQGDDEEAHQPRREDDTTMWMLVAMYTFLIVVAVNVFQWAFSTWRTVAENVESGLRESGTLSQYQRYRILAAQRTLREAERRRNEAEDALFQEIVQAYYPNSPPSRQSIDSRSRSSLRSRRSDSDRSRRSDRERSRRSDRDSRRSIPEGEGEREEAPMEDPNADYDETLEEAEGQNEEVEQQNEGEEEDAQEDEGDDPMDMMEDPLGVEEQALDDPTVHPQYNVWPVSAFRRGKGPGKGRAAGRAPRFNAFGRPIQRGLYLPENMDVTDEEQLAMYARNVWRGVNPGGEASGSGSSPSRLAQGTMEPHQGEEGEVARPDHLPPLEEDQEPLQDGEGQLRDGLDEIAENTVNHEEIAEDPMNQEEETTSGTEGSERDMLLRHEEGERDQPAVAMEEAAEPLPASAEPDQEPNSGEEERNGLQRGDQEREGQADAGGEPEPPIPVGELPDHAVLITPAGKRYHLSVSCPTLANTRRILRSDWCEYCCRRIPMQRRAQVHVSTPGEMAHFDRNCPHGGLRFLLPYPCCQMCPMPRLGRWEGEPYGLG